MNFLNSKVFTVLVGASLVWILFSVISLEIDKDEVKEGERNVKAKIDDTIHNNESLERFVKYFDSPLFLEKEARLRLNYKAPGEEVVFVHRDLNSKKTSSVDEILEDNLPNYKKWWYYLLGY